MDAIILLLISIFFLAQFVFGKTRFAFMQIGFFGFLMFLIAVVAVFGFASYQAWQQYGVWANSDFSKLFLPPYQDWSYFVFYVRTRFFNSYIFSLAAGLIAMAAARYLNKRYQFRFLDPLEPYLVGIGTFMTGYPLCFLYIPLVLTVGTIASSVLSLKGMPNGWRLSLYYLWLPIALLTILVSRWLALLPWWQMLQF